MISDHIFRAYDIRGISGEDFDAEGAYRIGKHTPHISSMMMESRPFSLRWT